MSATGALHLWRVKRRVALLFVFIFSLLLAACARSCSDGAPDSQTARLEFSFGDLSRSASIHLPPTEDKEASLPVVLVFHGGGGTAQGMERISHFDSTADRYDFIAVYP